MATTARCGGFRRFAVSVDEQARLRDEPKAEEPKAEEPKP